MQLLSSRDQTVTQDSQLDPSLPCQGLAHDGPNLMDIFLNSRAGGKWGSALSSVRLLNQHTEGVQVKSVPHWNSRKPNQNALMLLPYWMQKVYYSQLLEKYKVALNFLVDSWSLIVDSWTFNSSLKASDNLFSSCTKIFDLLHKEGWGRMAPGLFHIPSLEFVFAIVFWRG